MWLITCFLGVIQSLGAVAIHRPQPTMMRQKIPRLLYKAIWCLDTKGIVWGRTRRHPRGRPHSGADSRLAIAKLKSAKSNVSHGRRPECYHLLKVKGALNTPSTWRTIPPITWICYDFYKHGNRKTNMPLFFSSSSSCWAPLCVSDT